MGNITIDSASGNYARLIDINVKRFNETPAENDILNGNIRMKTLRNLFELLILEGIVIYGMANYKPRNSFKNEWDSKYWYVRTATDRLSGLISYIAIEERRDGIWILQKLIPLKSIASIKTEVMGTDETRFHVFITVPNIDEIETPSLINF